jgi:hypothetical protein
MWMLLLLLLPGAQDVDALLRGLDDDPPEVREEAAGALLRLGDSVLDRLERHAEGAATPDARGRAARLLRDLLLSREIRGLLQAVRAGPWGSSPLLIRPEMREETETGAAREIRASAAVRAALEGPGRPGAVEVLRREQAVHALSAGLLHQDYTLQLRCAGARCR